MNATNHIQNVYCLVLGPIYYYSFHQGMSSSSLRQAKLLKWGMGCRSALPGLAHKNLSGGKEEMSPKLRKGILWGW